MEKELEDWCKLHHFYREYEYPTKELAGYLKVSPRTIQRWVKGKTKPGKEKLNLVNKYLRKKAAQIAAHQDW